MTSLQAHLLIATPELADPFNRSVVLLIRHNEEGALGLILNRRTSATLREAWSRLSEVPCHRDDSLFLGGPCEGPLVALHTNEFLLETEVMPGLYFCAAGISSNNSRCKATVHRSSFSPDIQAGRPGNSKPKSRAARGR